MKAAVIEKWGGVEELKMKDIPFPKPGPGEVLVKIKAVSINPIDCKTRMGKGLASRLTLPAILGWDISGIVEKIGESAVSFKPGDEIFGMSAFPKEAKAYAEYAAVKADEFALKPENISHVEAAGYTLACLTAMQALYENTDISTKKRILIHGAAGGVGHFAVQLAKLKGAYIIGTAREKNFDFLKSLGIDETIDYSKNYFEKKTYDIDIVLDTMGGEIARRSIECMNADGAMVSIISTIKEDKELFSRAELKNIKVKSMLVHTSKENMNQIAELIKNEKLKINIDKIFPFDKIGEAHLAVESHSTRGKVIVVL